MQVIQEVAQGISFAVFAWYGMGCFLSKTMISEFDRYQLPHLRKSTGVLQVAASIGLLIGHFSRPILLLSAVGLSAMMFLAVITRIKIRDPFYLAIPAFFLCALNLFIAFSAIHARTR